MLKITNLYKTFNANTVNEKRALSGLNLTLNEGDFVTVIGGNGAGKSTMLNAISGVWKPDYGTIEIDGVNVTNMPAYKRASLLCRVFQDPMKGTAPDMEIAENLSI
ncbi:MAG: ATP-binding cassette domain-containing protein, partial [Clostridia bacterium]|nr:ATP-binding cassette domain-containing protein [Clostridia bacterium]